MRLFISFIIKINMKNKVIFSCRLYLEAILKVKPVTFSMLTIPRINIKNGSGEIL